MEKRSKHYGDVVKWIEKVIDSCETYRQSTTVLKLIRNFRQQLINKSPDTYWGSYHYDIISPLESRLRSRQYTITSTLDRGEDIDKLKKKLEDLTDKYSRVVTIQSDPKYLGTFEDDRNQIAKEIKLVKRKINNK